MSCFRILKTTCASIEKECSNFWWGLENDKRKMHWKKWDFLCKPKCEGGLRFRKLEVFNKELLANQLWMIIKNPSSLVARVLKGRYLKNRDLLQSSLGSNPSYIWRSLIWSRDMLETGLCWQIGDGTSVDIFADKWIPSLCSKIDSTGVQIPAGTKVYSLIRNNQWDEPKICSVCMPFLALEILSIPLSYLASGDKRFWKFDSKDHYSVRSGYRAGIELHTTPPHQ